MQYTTNTRGLTLIEVLIYSALIGVLVYTFCAYAITIQRDTSRLDTDIYHAYAE